MISSKHALKIVTEPNQEKRDAMIDKLTEADAKHALKVAISCIKGELREPAAK